MNTLNELQAKVCGLAGERDRLAARVAELETACDLARTAANFLSAERDIIAAELAAARAQEPVAYMSSRTGATVTKAQRQRMQNNGEYNKPLVFAAATPPVREPLTDATKASCALGYEECSHRCGTPHVCCDHYVEPEPIATPIPPVLEPDWLLETTKELAKAIHRDNYPDVPQWEVLDDLPGVISQIDNMVCGMERKTPVREPLSDNAILGIYNKVGQEDGAPYRFAGAIEAAIAQPATTEWTVIAPDGTRFTGPTPLKAALPASKYRLEIDPVAAVKFMEIIDQEAEKGRQEAEQCMRDYGTLDCPACGGSGHIGDVKQPAQVPAADRFTPPFSNCSFRLCDLPGQCRGEGKCHHPLPAAPKVK